MLCSTAEFGHKRTSRIVGGMFLHRRYGVMGKLEFLQLLELNDAIQTRTKMVVFASSRCVGRIADGLFYG